MYKDFFAQYLAMFLIFRICRKELDGKHHSDCNNREKVWEQNSSFHPSALKQLPHLERRPLLTLRLRMLSQLL